MDERSTVDLLHDHTASLRRFALVLTRNRDEAEDLVQETLMRAIAAADGWEPGTDLRAWLFKIMHNLHLSALRKRQVREAARPGLPNAVAEASQALRVEARQALEALETLPEAQRQAILMVAVEDMRYADAARVMGVPLGTFMSRLARGREALRRVMEGARLPRLRLVGGRAP
ncbi:sigma-70 family RNA polymerase sigma factor [Arenibaculum pallidiluteum]|uniref:sigma-70 family RNA polymerase sigma factor n=1 Tax=Arenibaculum pallidiluteum TaxID=2812559 RepID=UPI001A956797|nr:sigma-70 family RNA polymerase sigma factor [Arenibaculum pallidiluteum]